MANLLLTVRRAETPVYRYLKRVAWLLLTARVPLPGVLRIIYRALYACHFGARRLSRRVYMLLYGEPLFRSRCDKFGTNCLVWAVPEVTGHTKIQVGNRVSFWGDLGVTSGRTFNEPTLVLEDRVQIGHRVSIVVNREVVIEEGAMIANGCYITDSDSHPRDAVSHHSRLPKRTSNLSGSAGTRGLAWIALSTKV